MSNMVERGVRSGKEQVAWVGFTSFELVGFGVVPNVWRFGFGDLHLTIFLSFGEGKVLFVPLQTRVTESAENIGLQAMRIRFSSGVHCHPLKDLDRRIKLLTAVGWRFQGHS